MGIKSFLTKQVLKAKGVSGEEADRISKMMDENPALVDSLRELEKNKELKTLFENIQKEIDEKKKSGIPEMYAMMNVMSKYKEQVRKYQNELAPLLQIMQGMQGKK